MHFKRSSLQSLQLGIYHKSLLGGDCLVALSIRFDATTGEACKQPRETYPRYGVGPGFSRAPEDQDFTCARGLHFGC